MSEFCTCEATLRVLMPIGLLGPSKIGTGMRLYSAFNSPFRRIFPVPTAELFKKHPGLPVDLLYRPI